jgi:hypothetical protein
LFDTADFKSLSVGAAGAAATAARRPAAAVTRRTIREVRPAIDFSRETTILSPCLEG